MRCPWADPQHRGVDKTYARTLATATMMKKQHDRYCTAMAQFFEAIIRDQPRETVLHSLLHISVVDGLEIAVMTSVEQDQYGDYL